MRKADLTQLRQQAQAYNDKIAASEPVLEAEYMVALDAGDGIMGVLDIPEIGVILPIYHGVSEEVLSKGVGHMIHSALPLGGNGNHTVLTGHTGYPGAELLTRLTELQEGDMFTLSVLDQLLHYKIDRICIVLPEETEALKPEEGKDYCTLVTCTPYGINTHRLLVRGLRVEE